MADEHNTDEETISSSLPIARLWTFPLGYTATFQLAPFNDLKATEARQMAKPTLKATSLSGGHASATITFSMLLLQ